MTTRTGFTNLLTNTDNYKHTQFFQYPPGTEYVSSYIESRGGAFPATLFSGYRHSSGSISASRSLLKTLMRPKQLFAVQMSSSIGKSGWTC